MKLSWEDFQSLLPRKVFLSCCALDASVLNLLERLMNSVTDQPGHQPDIPYQPLWYPSSHPVGTPSDKKFVSQAAAALRGSAAAAVAADAGFDLTKLRDGREQLDIDRYVCVHARGCKFCCNSRGVTLLSFPAHTYISILPSRPSEGRPFDADDHASLLKILAVLEATRKIISLFQKLYSCERISGQNPTWFSVNSWVRQECAKSVQLHQWSCDGADLCLCLRSSSGYHLHIHGPGIWRWYHKKHWWFTRTINWVQGSAGQKLPQVEKVKLAGCLVFWQFDTIMIFWYVTWLLNWELLELYIPNQFRDFKLWLHIRCCIKG